MRFIDRPQTTLNCWHEHFATGYLSSLLGPPRMHFAIVSRLSSNQHKSTGLPHESHPSSLTPRKTVYPNAKTETRFNCRECRRISSIYYGMCTLNTVYKSCLYITSGFSWILIVYKTGSNCLCSHAAPTFLWDWHGIGLVKIEIRLELGLLFCYERTPKTIDTINVWSIIYQNKYISLYNCLYYSVHNSISSKCLRILSIVFLVKHSLILENISHRIPRGFS